MGTINFDQKFGSSRLEPQVLAKCTLYSECTGVYCTLPHMINNLLTIDYVRIIIPSMVVLTGLVTRPAQQGLTFYAASPRWGSIAIVATVATITFKWLLFICAFLILHTLPHSLPSLGNSQWRHLCGKHFLHLTGFPAIKHINTFPQAYLSIWNWSFEMKSFPSNK